MVVHETAILQIQTSTAPNTAFNNEPESIPKRKLKKTPKIQNVTLFTKHDN